MLFYQIPDAVAIVRKKGLFRQVKVYYRGRHIYAQQGSGFVFITNHGTSIPDLKVVDIDLGFEPEFCTLGRMMIPDKVLKKLEKLNG